MSVQLLHVLHAPCKSEFSGSIGGSTILGQLSPSSPQTEPLPLKILKFLLQLIYRTLSSHTNVLVVSSKVQQAPTSSESGCIAFDLVLNSIAIFYL